MKLFDYIRLFEHPGGVTTKIPHRITPIPGHAEALEAKFKAARHRIKFLEEEERKMLSELALALWDIDVKGGCLVQVSPKQH